MGRTKIIAALTLVVALIGALALWTVSNRGIRVGSKNFTEQVVLGEIIAQHLEHRLQQKVNRQLNLGGTLLAHGALVNQEIDVYPEYTGTALTAILKDPPDNDPAASPGACSIRICGSVSSRLAGSAGHRQQFRDGRERAPTLARSTWRI